MPSEQEKRFILGQVEYKAKGDKLTMSGYVSTKQPDLGGDICPPSSWDEFLPMYKNNPLYCYDHWLARGDNSAIGSVPPYPIGKVLNPYTDSEGLMLDKIELITDIPFVRDILSPLIQNEVLKQQSVGFLAFEKERDKEGHRILTRNWIQEGSIVPLAMNPFGTDVSLKNLGLDLQVLRGFSDFDNVESIVKAYQAGNLAPTKQFFMADPAQSFSTEEKPEHHGSKSMSKSLQPDFNKVLPTAHIAKAYNPDGEEIAKPPKYAKTYNEVCETLYAAYQESEDGERKFLFQIAVPTTDGFKYDFEKLALATAKVLGAKGGANWDGEEKKSVLERLAEAYNILEKRFPAYNRTPETPISQMKAWKLEDVEYREVEFFEGENDLVKRSIAKVDMANVLAAVKSGGVDDLPEYEELAKYLSGSISLNLVAYGWETAEVEFLVGIAQAWAEFNKDVDWYDYSFKAWFDNGNLVYAKVGKAAQGNSKSVRYEKDEQGFRPTEVSVTVPDSATDVPNLDEYTRCKMLHNAISAKLDTLEKGIQIKNIASEDSFKKAMARLESF